MIKVTIIQDGTGVCEAGYQRTISNRITFYGVEKVALFDPKSCEEPVDAVTALKIYHPDFGFLWIKETKQQIYDQQRACCTAPPVQSVNIYNTDGALDANRIVTVDGYSLTFSGQRTSITVLDDATAPSVLLAATDGSTPGIKAQMGVFGATGAVRAFVDGEIELKSFPNNRDDTSTPANILATDPNGNLRSFNSTKIPTLYTSNGIITANRTVTVQANLAFNMATNQTNFSVNTGRLCLEKIQLNNTDTRRNLYIAGAINAGAFNGQIQRGIYIGMFPAQTQVSGLYNIVISADGANALNIGDDNILMGQQVMYNVISASNNIAIGKKAMGGAGVLSNNIAIGEDAGTQSATTWGSFFGRRAGYNITGNNVTVLGNHDGTVTSTLNNVTLLGGSGAYLSNVLVNRFVDNGDEFQVGGDSTMTGSLVVGAVTHVPSAVLQADSTAKGFLPPRMTEAQRTAIASPAVGLIVYQTDDPQTLNQDGLWVNKASGWSFIA